MSLLAQVRVDVPDVTVPPGDPASLRTAATALSHAEGSLVAAAWRVAADVRAVEAGSMWCGRASASYVGAASTHRAALLEAAEGIAVMATAWRRYGDELEAALRQALRARSTAVALSAEYDALVARALRLDEARGTAVADAFHAAQLFVVVPGQLDEVARLNADADRLRAECARVRRAATDAMTEAERAAVRAGSAVAAAARTTRASRRAAAAALHQRLADEGLVAAEDGSLGSRTSGLASALRDDVVEPLDLLAGLAGLRGDLPGHWKALGRGVGAAVQDPLSALRAAVDWTDIDQGDWGHWVGTVGPGAVVTFGSGGAYGAARSARVLDALRSQEEVAAYVRRLLDRAEEEALGRLYLEWGSLSTPLVPGGGLAAHELAEGHLILRHVGLDETALRARFTRHAWVEISSSFPDRRTAEALVAQALTMRAPEIATWLGGAEAELALFTDLRSPTGILVRRGRPGTQMATWVKVVLVRAQTPLGFRIKTGFPWAPRRPRTP